MLAGNLDRRITLQRKTTTASSSGHPAETWTTLATKFASFAPVRGAERFGVPAEDAQQQVQFDIRYATALSDLSPLDRVVFPSLEDQSPEPAPDPAAIYDIVAVHEIGRREGLRIIAVRHPDR
jgi:head-tail adaptor